MSTYISISFFRVSVFRVTFSFPCFAFLFLVIHGFSACMGNISDVGTRHIFMNIILLLNLVGQFCNIPRHGNKKVILLQVVTGLLATSEANSLLNVIFDYCSHTAVPIMAQFYGHYMIEVLTMFA